MEILECKPLGFKDFLRASQTEGTDYPRLEFIVAHTVLRSAAYVVEIVPERIRHPILADIGQKPARILYGGPFENSGHRHVESCRSHSLEQIGVKDS